MSACLTALDSRRNDGCYLTRLALSDEDLSDIESRKRCIRTSQITMIIVSIAAGTG